MSKVARIVCLTVIALESAACASSIAPMSPAPTPESTPGHRAATGLASTVTRASVPPANPNLPAVPEVDGPLHISVIYPTSGALITSRDSNFIFGSIGNGQAGLRINGTLVPVWPNGSFMAWLPNPPADKPEYDLVAYTESDTAHYVHPVRIRTDHPAKSIKSETPTLVSPPNLATLHDDSLAKFVDDTDRTIIGRPTPEGIYHWFLFPGTTVAVDGYLGDMARVALDDKQRIWVDRSDIELLNNTAPEPATKTAPSKSARKTTSKSHRRPSSPLTPLKVTTALLTPDRDWIDLTLRVSAPPAYYVDESEKGLTLTLYNTTVTSDDPIWSASHPDPYLISTSMHTSTTRSTFTFGFARPVYGYLALYHNGTMTFRIRRPPEVNPALPLRGMTITIDAGHPPAGATGPTGLYEAVATLAVARRVQTMLIAQGAKVIMTRTNENPVALGDRPIVARRTDANALVSIHLNALPDGMNPFHNNGTGTYYFQPHSKLLAGFVQQSLVPELKLRDLGVFQKNLALARPTWMPAVLTEGAFIIMPDQEAALRTPQYQDAYARGIVNGLAKFFATFAQ